MCIRDRPEVEKGDIINLAPYHFYMKVTGDESEDAFSGQTTPLDIEESKKTTKLITNTSRKLYGSPKTKIEAYMENLFAEAATKLDKTQTSKKANTAPTSNKNRVKTHDL